MHARFISFFDAPILLPVKSNAHFVKVKIIAYISLIRRSFAIFNLLKKLLQRSKGVLLSLMALGNRVISIKTGKIEMASAIFWDYLGMFREYGQKNILLGIKLFLFFKIESWNFQNLFENEFRETSQSFNTFS